MLEILLEKKYASSQNTVTMRVKNYTEYNWLMSGKLFIMSHLAGQESTIGINVIDIDLVL